MTAKQTFPLWKFQREATRRNKFLINCLQSSAIDVAVIITVQLLTHSFERKIISIVMSSPWIKVFNFARGYNGDE